MLETELQRLQYYLSKGDINRTFYEAYLKVLQNEGAINPGKYAAGIAYKDKRSFEQKKAEALELMGRKKHEF